jgi:hypothetical protein
LNRDFFFGGILIDCRFATKMLLLEPMKEVPSEVEELPGFIGSRL